MSKYCRKHAGISSDCISCQLGVMLPDLVRAEVRRQLAEKGSND